MHTRRRRRTVLKPVSSIDQNNSWFGKTTRRIQLFFRRFVRALKRRNPRTIIAASVAGLLIIAIPMIIIAVNSGHKEVSNLPLPTPSGYVVSPTPELTPVPAPLHLEFGATDPLLMTIQERLMKLGYMDPYEPTNYFGPATRSAVKLFQRQSKLEQTGIIDDALYLALMSDTAKNYMISNGDEGDDVEDIQNRLYQLGYLSDKKSVTGHFGTVTEDAVKQFQQKNGIAADGKVGENTREMLYSPDSKANILSPGEKNDIVLKYQKKLMTLAYLTTEPDGKYGKDTIAAVKMFQEKNALVVDGYLGPATRELIDSGHAQPNALTIGDSGDTVKNVQKLLVEANCLTNASTTGYYGSVTEAAAQLFQATNGLTVDGKIGMKTLGLLSSGTYKKAKEPIVSGTTPTSPSSKTVEKLIAIARAKLGFPYVRGAKGPNAFDCSGFVYWCLNQAGLKQSYLTSYGWRTIGKYTKITSINAVKTGDIIVFHIDGINSTHGHMGIALSDNSMIHAMNDDVMISTLKQPYWMSRFICAWRIF